MATSKPKRQKLQRGEVAIKSKEPRLPKLTAEDKAGPKLVKEGLASKLRNEPWLYAAFRLFRKSCTYGNSYDNNCARYLSNAFFLAAPDYRFPASYAKCPHGRLIRAKEMLAWFRTIQSQFKQNCSGITQHVWFVYQESGGQGHVVLHRHHGGFAWKGTGNYPNWPVQWHYLY